ncbi:MAG: aminoacyl-histidine dipeptidase [Bacteroidales bacterium]|nr:aminoacyl-histidine dipeptidase [Bacteroidales bacterium]
MSILKGLKPEPVWHYFEEITKVPRPSKKEEKIIEFLLNFGKSLNLETKRDKIGNVVISKPASPGMENLQKVVLQSHMDMVCEKNSDVDFDFDTMAIQPVIDGEWVKAKGTTLGADDGIGMAAQMAILASDNIKHGAIECLFTVDEETGLTGAFELEKGMFDAKILLNLDSEDEGELFIGCAGGIDTVATFDYIIESVPANHSAYKIQVKGLKGGHSGDEIHKSHGNSIKILNRILWQGVEELEMQIAEINGGNLRNAIPREAFAIVTIPNEHCNDFEKWIAQFQTEVRQELSQTAPDLSVSCSKSNMPASVIDEDTKFNLVYGLYACPHGVHTWSQQLEGLVETSTNLASVKFVENNRIVVTTSQRSSLESGKADMAFMVDSVFSLAGAEIKRGDGYPGWNPNPNSNILRIAAASYERLFGKKPVVRAIHAGLECGLFLEKYPDLDMISFGPTLRSVHSPDERINIKTVEMWWNHLLDVLENIPSK